MTRAMPSSFHLNNGRARVYIGPYKPSGFKIYKYKYKFFLCSPIVYPRCTDDEYQCNNGQCIDKFKRCDLALDCVDESDEKKCGMF